MASSTRLKTTTVTGRRIDATRMHVETSSGGEFVVGEDGSPGEYLLGSLAGDVEPRTYEGKASEPRAGNQSIRVAIDVDADADSDTLDEWTRAVEERCPVCDNVSAETPTTASIGPA